MEITAASLESLLNETGDSANIIADRLRRRGIKGVRNAVRILNPIIEYVQDSLKSSGIAMNLIDPDVLHVRLGDGAMIAAVVPQAVKDFLQSFNDGMYPDLEATESQNLSEPRQ